MNSALVHTSVTARGPDGTLGFQGTSQMRTDAESSCKSDHNVPFLSGDHPPQCTIHSWRAWVVAKELALSTDQRCKISVQDALASSQLDSR